ncbi:MAG: DUF3592 domain-containing protein [Opitutaceae bacterium]|nr:DUF3592 domain-containing protein [Opitutaceae bacterium]
MTPGSPNRAALLAGFLAEPAPRRAVPAEIRRAARGQAAPLLVAGFGLLFAGFGFFFVGLFTPWKLLQDWRLNRAPTARGQVEAVAGTNLRVNKVRVMRYTLSFPPAGGARQQAECFTTGARWRAGDEVTVRYLPDRPAVSRIEGARRSESDPAALFVWVFPAVGLGLVAWVVIARRRMDELLVNGAVAEAQVADVQPTRSRVNKRTVFAITLRRPDGEPLVVRRHQPDIVAFAQERRASQQPVFVLYDPAHPRRVLLPETL